MTTPSHEHRDPRELRWSLIRDLSVFVTKVGLEAIRDIALIPLAVGAGLLGLLFSPSQPHRYFEAVLRLGDRFDVFVDLFGSAEARKRAGMSAEDAGGPRADALFERVERALRDQHAQGGVTAQAKEAIDRALDAVQRGLSSGPARRRERPYTALGHSAPDKTPEKRPGAEDER